ncbi:hypothetical protein Pint_12271 [Pistacia integerrima]|uniref:Uncharacterized protein n=1 Tax=Pistacia integerrima TaxID=434235 RepID=A0ACC0XJZ1_9ROSI|nr:hypothetical protein Pint_12271 [Pistacia integerrima]
MAAQSGHKEMVKFLYEDLLFISNEDKYVNEEDQCKLIHSLIRTGIYDIALQLLKEKPQLATRRDESNGETALLILGRTPINLPLKKLILQYKDDEENNILHLAGKMPSREQFNNVLGVALQLQQELFWFKEVERIVDPMDVKAENKDKKTPTDLFNEKMTDLKKEAFTVPGGTKDDTGTPHFIRKVSFIIFVISDAIALASSSWSILTILSIYTTRYTDEDFVMLPRNLVVGLSTLFLSIAAVMVVFCATIFIVFKHGKIWVPTLASIIASLPVISFTKQHLQHFYGVARLTFGKSFLSKTGKHSLFDDDDNDEGKSWNLKEQKDAACRNFLLKCWDFIHYRCSNFLEECWNSTYSRFFD